MTNDQVHASSADLKRLATELETYKKEVAAASKKVRGALNRANWHDSRKTQFEAKYSEHQQRVDRFMASEVDQMAKALRELARKLDDIKSVRM